MFAHCAISQLRFSDNTPHFSPGAYVGLAVSSTLTRLSYLLHQPVEMLIESLS